MDQKDNQQIEQKGNRHLTIQYKSISRPQGPCATFPEIRLMGNWLQKLGFEIGRKVTVIQEINKLTSTLDEYHESKEEKKKRLQVEKAQR